MCLLTLFVNKPQHIHWPQKIKSVGLVYLNYFVQINQVLDRTPVFTIYQMGNTI